MFDAATVHKVVEAAKLHAALTRSEVTTDTVWGEVLKLGLTDDALKLEIANAAEVVLGIPGFED